MTQVNQTDQERVVVMQEYHDLFISGLMLLLDVLKTHGVDPVARFSEKLMGALTDNKVDIDKKGVIIKKVFMILDTYFDLLKGQDSKLFNLYTKQGTKSVKVTIVPGIDIGSVWKGIVPDSQAQVWRYLRFMYVASSQMINTSGNNNNVVNVTRIQELGCQGGSLREEFWARFPGSGLVSVPAGASGASGASAVPVAGAPTPAFNPFVGVGENTAEYGVSDLLSGPALLPDQTAPGVEGISKMLGIDKMLNMEDLAKQLKNITKEQIEQATKSIKALLGDVDAGTSEMIDMMLTDITDELKREDISSGQPINNLVKIAETVAHKMMPKIDPKKVDMKKVWDSTRNIATKCHDKDGKPIFDGPNNPLSLVTGLMEKQMMMQGRRSGAKNKGRGKGGADSDAGAGDPALSEEEYIKECQDMLKQMGMPHMAPDQVKNLRIDQLLGEIQKNPPPASGKSTASASGKSTASASDTKSTASGTKSKRSKAKSQAP